MNNKKQTAVDWLLHRVDEYTSGGVQVPNDALLRFILKAKQMEEEREYETKAIWFGRGILAGKEDRVSELKPTKNK